jgi:hypothetical protein
MPRLKTGESAATQAGALGEIRESEPPLVAEDADSMTDVFPQRIHRPPGGGGRFHLVFSPMYSLPA